jgi:PAS domain S-box-containing protein
MLLDAAGEGIYGVDMQGNITFINPSALAMLGLTEEEALGRNAHALFHGRSPDGSDDSVENCPLDRTLRDGQRYEGEEFAVLLEGRGLTSAKQYAERLLQEVQSRYVQLDEEQIRFTISIGITPLLPEDGSPDAAIRRADAALYRAKAPA